MRSRISGRGGDVEQAGDRARRLAERRMRGDVLDALAVDEDAPAVVERAEIFGARAHHVAPFPSF